MNGVTAEAIVKRLECIGMDIPSRQGGYREIRFARLCTVHEDPSIEEHVEIRIDGKTEFDMVIRKTE